jgi:DNA-binding NarL/FixJ family response regulator
MEKIKVILIDDHQIVRDGIKSLLSDAADIEVISEAGSYYELKEKLKLQDPDIVLLDISLPEVSGIEITKFISENYPKIKVLILSMYTGEDFIFNAIKAGAKGYLPKNTTKKEIIDAIRAVFNNQEYFSESISKIMLKSYVNKAKTSDNQPLQDNERLSARELEILKHVAAGLSNHEIAEKLFISVRTVESHKNHIMQKLELKSTVDLIKFALKKNLLEM